MELFQSPRLRVVLSVLLMSARVRLGWSDHLLSQFLGLRGHSGDASDRGMPAALSFF